MDKLLRGGACCRAGFLSIWMKIQARNATPIASATMKKMEGRPAAF
ncbi:MAG TPA: hypothetical protein VF980_02615 [Thermoanaerobaculia bacterium]